LPPDHVVQSGNVDRQTIRKVRPGQPLSRTDPVTGPMTEQGPVALVSFRQRSGSHVESAPAAVGKHFENGRPHRNRQRFVLGSRCCEGPGTSAWGIVGRHGLPRRKSFWTITTCRRPDPINSCRQQRESSRRDASTKSVPPSATRGAAMRRRCSCRAIRGSPRP
jgi:hypothetical protein